jgi:Transposase zinc-binding domain
VSGLQASAPGVYRRHRPETTALYEVVRDNLETLYGAIDDGARAVRIPKHARKELEAYLDCGLLYRGFARLKCEGCGEKRLVAFSCKRGTRRRRARSCQKLRGRMGTRPRAEAGWPVVLGKPVCKRGPGDASVRSLVTRVSVIPFRRLSR